MDARTATLITGLLGSPMIMAEPASQVPSMDPINLMSLLQIVASLVFVLLVFAGVIYVMRRVTGINPAMAGHMKIVDGLSLGTRDRIVLLQVGKEQVLLGISPGQIRKLHVMDEAVDFSQPVSRDNFSDKLRHVMAGKRPFKQANGPADAAGTDQ